jgi:hypothetical protein
MPAVWKAAPPAFRLDFTDCGFLSQRCFYPIGYAFPIFNPNELWYKGASNEEIDISLVFSV